MYCAYNQNGTAISPLVSWTDAQTLCDQWLNMRSWAPASSAEYNYVTRAFPVASTNNTYGYWTLGGRAGINSKPYSLADDEGSAFMQSASINSPSVNYRPATGNDNCALGYGCAVGVVYSLGVPSLQYMDAALGLSIMCEGPKPGTNPPPAQPYPGFSGLPPAPATADQPGVSRVKIPSSKASLTIGRQACLAIVNNDAPFKIAFAAATAGGFTNSTGIVVQAGDVTVTDVAKACAAAASGRRSLLRWLLQSSSSSVTTTFDMLLPPGTSVEAATAANSKFSSQANSIYTSGQFGSNFQVTGASVTMGTPLSVDGPSDDDDKKRRLALGLGIGLGLGIPILIAIIVGIVLAMKRRGDQNVQPVAASSGGHE